MDLLRNETVGRRMDAGRAVGFDYLRIGLAVAVIAFHSVITSFGPGADKAIAHGWMRPFILAILPMFFALSGFLVAGSLVRCRNLGEYAALRVLRIVPALFVEVCVAALILGPLMTVDSLRDYFANPKLHAYFLNTIGHIHYQLPGLFLDNPDPDMVNRQLWTIPGELKCYFVLMVLAAVGVVRRSGLLVGFILLCALALPFVDLFLKHERVAELNTVTMNTLVLAFLCGVAVHALKDKIRIGFLPTLVAGLVSYALLSVPEMQYAAMAPLAYLTVGLGLAHAPRSWLSDLGDYSYGLYLYGYPLQQTYSHLFPDHRQPILNILFTLVTAGVLAALSWRFVEKPVLRHRETVLGLFSRFGGSRREPTTAFGRR